MPFTYKHPHPSVTVDIVVFGIGDEGDNQFYVLLIERGRKGEPFYGCWAIPGGFVNEDEDLEVAARRELKEETHAEPKFLEQVKAFGTPGRDPRGHVISVAYMTVVRCNDVTVKADDDAKAAKWWPVVALPKLAFDHTDIMLEAIRKLEREGGLEAALRTLTK